MIENIIKDHGLDIIITETVIIVALLLWQLLSSARHSEEIEKLKHEKKGLEKESSENNEKLSPDIKAPNKAKSDLKQESDWNAKNKHPLENREQKAAVVEFDLSQEPKQQVNASQVLYQYLQEANAGKFLRILSSPEKCYFRTWEEGGVRKYEFYGNVAKALANINAIFDDVCEMEGKRSGATIIENVSAGTLDSELRITSKAKIRLR